MRRSLIIDALVVLSPTSGKIVIAARSKVIIAPERGRPDRGLAQQVIDP